jgi:site-specific DNA-methyltransferase (adenine-specific)
MPISEVFNMDCMEALRKMKDKEFDLAIVDPEFGIGIGKSPRLVTDKGLKAKTWDDKPISMEYFDDLFRVSKRQIIWGGNYYNLGATKHCIIWDKVQPEGLSFGMFDFAWTSFEGANKIFRYSVQLEKNKIHPTQKPVSLYKWLLLNYAKQGDKILDTHVGSGSSRIAAYKLGFDFTGYELDLDYYQAQEKRFKEAINEPLLQHISYSQQSFL